MDWRIFEVFLWLTWNPFLASGTDLLKETNVDSSRGTVITNEFCGYEKFVARCNPGEVILVRNASFGRMRAGKCVTGDYSHAIGCSSDVTSHVSNMCTGRQNCSFLVAMMDSVAQPCAKDFKSYLEASYVCHKASFLDKTCRDVSVVLTKTEWSGYLAFYWRHLVLNPPREFGSTCTWRFTVEDGRRIELSWIKTFQDIIQVKPTPISRYRNLSLLSHHVKPSSRCPVKMWISEYSDNEVSVSACQDLPSRHKTFYTSLGNKLLLKVQIELSAKDEMVSFYANRPNEVLPWHNKLLHFKAIGCPKVEQSGDHTTWQHGDSAAVVCASSGKTWYLTCREGKWIGFVGNCSKADHKILVSAEASNMGPTELSNGAVMAVLVGVVTGFAIGMLLLFAIVFTKRSYRRGRMQDRNHKKLEIVSHGHGNNYFTMTNTPNNSVKMKDSFTFKEDCLQTIDDVNENNNNNRLAHHKVQQGQTTNDILGLPPKTANPSPLFQFGQTVCSLSSASEPIKRRSGNYCIHRQCPNLPDFLSTCSSPDCSECCLCSTTDNFLISVTSHGDDFHNFTDAMESLCNQGDDLDEHSFLHCSKKEVAQELQCPPPVFVSTALENIRLLSHPLRGCFGKNCQFSICARPSPMHRSSFESCECGSNSSPRVKLSYVTSSGHNSQCTVQGTADDPALRQTNCTSNPEQKKESDVIGEGISCLKTFPVDG